MSSRYPGPPPPTDVMSFIVDRFNTNLIYVLYLLLMQNLIEKLMLNTWKGKKLKMHFVSF